MTTRCDPDQLIQSFLHEGMTELPDRAYDEVRAEIDHTRQRFVFGPWRELQVTRFATFGIAAAVLVLAAVVMIRFLPSNDGIGVGGQPTPTLTVAPTAAPTEAPTSSPSPTPSAIADPSGRLQPGTYVAHPFDSLLGMDARGFTFTTPSANWEAQGDPGRTIGVAWNDGSGNSGGVGLGFLKVDSLNGDACHWVGTDDDVAIGPTVDDLLEALASATNFDGGDDPYTEYVANATGQGVELTMPATLLEEGDVNCDEEAYRIWNASGFDIYAQGPSNKWRLGIFDVSGERYIVMASYMPDTPDEVRNEMMSIFRSVTIDSSPGCPTYAHSCN